MKYTISVTDKQDGRRYTGEFTATTAKQALKLASDFYTNELDTDESGIKVELLSSLSTNKEFIITYTPIESTTAVYFTGAHLGFATFGSRAQAQTFKSRSGAETFIAKEGLRRCNVVTK